MQSLRKRLMMSRKFCILKCVVTLGNVLMIRFWIIEVERLMRVVCGETLIWKQKTLCGLLGLFWQLGFLLGLSLLLSRLCHDITTISHRRIITPLLYIKHSCSSMPSAVSDPNFTISDFLTHYVFCSIGLVFVPRCNVIWWIISFIVWTSFSFYLCWIFEIYVCLWKFRMQFILN